MAEQGAGIDFVITWVDGSDPMWRAEYAKYSATGDKYGQKSARFRDWGLLRYWFRGVENFAPWVGKVHFVTWGHLPPWLDTSHPKLHIVNHRDFIPGEYLPTFNTNTIELNLHRIPGLSDRFVYFNDDVFMLDAATPGFFFRGDMPRDFFSLEAPMFSSRTIGHTVAENMSVVNDFIPASEAYAKNIRAMLSPSLGWRRVLKNIALRRIFPKYLIGFENRHSFIAFRKSSFEEVWKAAGERLDATCRHRFRTRSDQSDWLVRYWRLAKGEFFHASPAPFRCVHLNGRNTANCVATISGRACKVFCVNDNSRIEEFESIGREIRAAFDTILPRKSAFEKDVP